MPGDRAARLILGAACMLLAGVSTSLATSLIEQQELPALVAESQRAVLAQVVEVRHGRDEHRLASTWVVLRVEDRLFGNDVPDPGGRMEIKLFGSALPLSDGSRLFVDGTPDYRVGERYLLLLIGRSDWGFTNTAGLFQGAFRVFGGPGETPTARGLAGNRSVFGAEGLERWLDAGARNRAPLSRGDGDVSYADLRQAILNLWNAAPPARSRGER